MITFQNVNLTEKLEYLFEVNDNYDELEKIIIEITHDIRRKKEIEKPFDWYSCVKLTKIEAIKKFWGYGNHKSKYSLKSAKEEVERHLEFSNICSSVRKFD